LALVIAVAPWSRCAVIGPPSADTRTSSAIRAVVIGAQTARPLQQVVRTLAERGGFALVVACPGDRDVAAMLRPHSVLPVTEVHERAQLEPDRLYVVPSDHDGAFHRGELHVTSAREPRAPIDRLLRSLADDLGGQVAGVILSGHGSDGVIGIKRVKEAGGLTIAQAPEGDDAEMPRSAIATGMIDLVLPLSEIGDRLAAFGRHAADASPAISEVEHRGVEGIADTLRDILSLVRVRSGHDFASYKRATLYRRVSRRMQVCQCESITAYHHHLREHPAELGNLLRDFLISVTNFFRDRAAFEALDTAVLPRLFAGKGAGDQVRVWVSGCATGEEAYSIAMLLLEHASELREPPQLQVFATDIDEDALAEARQGRYPRAIALDISPERLKKFFVEDNDHYRITKELRELVLFSPHNLLRDPPFSRLDLISCRNLLIYLNRDAQDRCLNVFHFGLRADGFLFLGSSESAENTALFTGVDLKHRVFVRRSNPSRLTESIVTTGRWYPAPPPPSPPSVERRTAGELHQRLVERYAPPSILVDEELDILHVSEHAGQLLRISGGEPSRQLLRLIHPALRAELRTAIYTARRTPEGRDTRVVRFNEGDTPRAIELRVRAVDRPELGRGLLLLLFDELGPDPGNGASEASQAAALEPVMREIEDELRRTRDQLRSTVEQYETSLEELKASNEELHAINEELRAATEELETSKEELQSVNEELTTVNQELKLKVDEVSDANGDLQNLMSSTEIGVLFLDRALHIKRFTPRAQDVFNIIPSDVGRPLGHVTHRLDATDLPQLAHAVLQTLHTIEREVRSIDGRRYLARVLPYRSLEDRIDGVVLTFVEVTDLRAAVDARRRSEAALLVSEQRLRFALRSAPMLVAIHDAQLQLTWGYALGEELAVPSGLRELLAPGQADKFAAFAHRVLRTGDRERTELELMIAGERRIYDLRLERTELGLQSFGFDITSGKIAEAELLDADHRKDEFLATLSHELRNPLTPLQVALDVARLSGGDPERLERSLGIMERQVAQLTQLVDELLDLSRITQGKIDLERIALDPVTVVEAALEATQSLIEGHHHHLAIELPKQSSQVIGDKARLTQVLTNLIGNAAKYTPDGGHIELRLDVDPVRGALEIRVRDDGHGIPAELIPRIFDIFVQGRAPDGRAHGGLGIGLNLVRRLVELHGGRVSASSDGPGRGSEFTIELPLERREPPSR
jgi:two-component system, chemotaxis family, CheB/CheR fusion protein